MDFSNQASLNYNNKIINSNTVNGIITKDITMKKSSRTDNYKPDSEIFYTITIKNNSNVTYNQMMLIDNLGRYVWNGLTRFLLEYIPYSQEFLLIDSNGLTKK